MDVASTYFTSRQAVARYSAPATTGLDSDAFIEAKCLEVPQFKGVDTLQYFAHESIEEYSEIEDVATTFVNQIVPDDEYMYLYDETKKAKKFVPLQFHYHAPSEHTIDGYLYDLELHIVHKNENATELSVLGIFFDMKKGGNSTNPFLD